MYYWIPFAIRVPRWLLRRLYGDAAFWLPEHKRTEGACTEDDSLYCCGRHCHH